MNAPESFDTLLAASREPFSGSRKVHVDGSLPACGCRCARSP
jgi:hypothetical protein